MQVCRVNPGAMNTATVRFFDRADQLDSLFSGTFHASPIVFFEPSNSAWNG